MQRYRIAIFVLIALLALAACQDDERSGWNDMAAGDVTLLPGDALTIRCEQCPTCAPATLTPTPALTPTPTPLPLNARYVATDGDNANPGTEAQPWRTIDYAAAQLAPDGGTVIVADGVHTNAIFINESYDTPLHIVAQHPYRATIKNNGSYGVIKLYTGANNIVIEGFEITRPRNCDNPFLVDINGNNITLRNNVLHDAYHNDLVKIYGPGQSGILIEGNMFYNQGTLRHPEYKDEHLDINVGSSGVIVQDNIFFNDFAGSGRSNPGSHSFIVIKNSKPHNAPPSATVRRNVFLNWEGATNKHFVLVGEDGISNWEADGITIENNLMLGNSANKMSAPFGVRGSKNITIRSNTIVGDLPAKHFGLTIFTTGDNRPSESVNFYNNIWSDPTGTMGSDFSCCSWAPIGPFSFANNLFWNAGNAFPTGTSSLVEVTDDVHRVVGNPYLGDQGAGITVPRWNGNGFNGGYDTIREAFEDLVTRYGVPGPRSAAIDRADPAHMPDDDILGRVRSEIDDAPDVGAYEYQDAGVIIIDDVDPGFSTSAEQDEWQQYEQSDGRHYGGAHHYNQEIGTGDDTATWSFTVPQPGRYEVYAWWWEGSWRPDDVPYTIDHLDGSTTLRVNQQTDGAQWNLLGIFEFEDQGSVMVSDDVSSGRDVVADAVRLVYLGPLAATEGYYVATHGDDGNPGTEALPFRTIQKGVDTAQDSETVYARHGTYHEQVVINNAITLQSYPGEMATIDGQRTIPGEWDYLLKLNSDNATVANLEVTGGGKNVTGVGLVGDHNVVSGLHVHHNGGTGIYAAGDHNLITGCTVWWNSDDNENGAASIWGGGLALGHGTGYNIARGNTVYNNWGEGILSMRNSTHNIIEQNIAYDNWSVNVYGNGSHVTIQRNLIYTTGDTRFYRLGTRPATGIAMCDETQYLSEHKTVINNLVVGCNLAFYYFIQQEGAGLKNALIAHNTFVNSDRNALFQISAGEHEDVRIENNIFVQDDDLPIAVLPNSGALSFSRNLWSKTPPAPAGSNDIIAAALLARIGPTGAGTLTPDWFRLLPGSPAVDAGIILSQVPRDFDGVTRPQGAGYDIGAFE